MRKDDEALFKRAVDKDDRREEREQIAVTMPRADWRDVVWILDEIAPQLSPDLKRARDAIAARVEDYAGSAE